MYSVTNMIDEQPIKHFTDNKFVAFAKMIQVENGDEDITIKITNAQRAEEYIHEYCDNLRFNWSKN